MDLSQMLDASKHFSVDSPFGLAIFVWISSQLHSLNTKIAVVISRLEAHDERLSKLESHSFLKTL